MDLNSLHKLSRSVLRIITVTNALVIFVSLAIIAFGVFRVVTSPSRAEQIHREYEQRRANASGLSVQHSTSPSLNTHQLSRNSENQAIDLDLLTGWLAILFGLGLGASATFILPKVWDFYPSESVGSGWENFDDDYNKKYFK